MAINCLHYGSEIPKNAKACPSYGAERVRCSVCNLDIVSEELLVKCPHCGLPNHKEHLIEWIKVRGTMSKLQEKVEGNRNILKYYRVGNNNFRQNTEHLDIIQKSNSP